MDKLGWTKEQLEELRYAGFSFFREGCYDKALVYFKALVVLDPESIYDKQTLGAIYAEMGQNTLALEVLGEALLLDPNHEPTRLNLAKVHLVEGNISEGAALATELITSSNPNIASDSEALLLAYR